jgi:hypothetical protein
MSEQKYPKVRQDPLTDIWFVAWSDTARSWMPDERTARMCAAAAEAFALLREVEPLYEMPEGMKWPTRIPEGWMQRRRALLASVQGEQGEGK